ncbi:MAG: hypothetical protein ACTSW3_06185 [Promethearchaeota archaeon]
MMKNEIISIIIILSLVFNSIILGYIAEDDISKLIRRIKNKQVDTPEECVNLSLIETANCLNNYVISIYKYNKTDDSKSLTIEELKKRGGDCNDWTDLYIGYIEDLKFDAKKVIINTGKNAHAFAIISDETGYCKLDQRSLDCLMFKD